MTNVHRPVFLSDGSNQRKTREYSGTGVGSEDEMSKESYSRLAGTIFLIVAVLHALRLAFHWQVVLPDCQAPVWISAVAMAVAAFLADEGFHAKS